MFKVNMSKSANVIPNGDYLLLVSKAEETKSKAGNPMAKMEYKVVEGPGPKGFVVRDNIVSADAASFRVRAFVNGFEDYSIDDEFTGDVEFEPGDFINKTFWAKVEKSSGDDGYAPKSEVIKIYEWDKPPTATTDYDSAGDSDEPKTKTRRRGEPAEDEE